MSDESITPTPVPEAPQVPAVPVVAETPPTPIALAIVPAAEPKPDAKPEPLDLAAELEQMRKRTAELEAAIAAEKGETRTLAFTAAFDRAGVSPQYRDFLRGQLGDTDPRSEAGLKAIDDLAKKHPAMLTAHVSTADPMADYLRAKTAEARKGGNTSMWGLIPPDMVRGMADGVDR